MMSTEPRTDVHRPKEIRPEDYSWRHSFDTQPPMFMPVGNVTQADIERAQAAMEEWHKLFEQFVMAPIRHSAATVYGSPNRCDHCGAHLRYGNLYHHEPTGGVIVVGDICADETMEVPDRAKLQQKRIREAAASARMREANNKAARQRIEVAEKSYPEATAILEHYEGDNYFIEDVAGKFKHNGYLSEKQAAAIVRAHRRDIDRAAQAEKEKARVEAGEVEAVPTDGRQVVTGEIVKEYWKDGYPSNRHVMIVRDDRGFKVWGSVPSGLYEEVEGENHSHTIVPRSGDRVTFTAALEQSPEDPTFGFTKRPTKARTLERAGEE